MPCSGHFGFFQIAVFAMGMVLLFPCRAQAQLRTALEVRSLDSETAETGKRVDLEAIVIYCDVPSTIFVQDGTAGTFFRLEGADPPRPGDRVRVRGVTIPGLYLSGIESTQFEILGHPGLPEATPVDTDDLASGLFHYQRVSIRGIVRTVSPEGENGSLVRVSAGREIVEVYLEETPVQPEKWIDSEVLVKGLAAGNINARRQLVAPYLRCSGWEEFEKLKSGPADKDIPLVSTSELLRFDVTGQAGHRVRVTGTVLANFRDRRVFLRDGESALSISLTEHYPELVPGDTVEVIGFPRMDQFSASLVDASIVSREEQGTLPDPVSMTFAELMEGKGDSDLISTEGAVTDQYRAGKNSVMVLRDGKQNLQVRIPTLPEEILLGSTVRVIGIGKVDAAGGTSYFSRPESVSVEMRTADDLRILRAPRWWTPRRLLIGVIALLVVVAASGLWIGLLKRQMHRQTLDIKERIEHEAALEERQRIAREFHDTLEQNLAGLSLRLDAATSRDIDEKLRGFLEGSRRLVSRIQTETRNLVSDLRHFSDEEADLKEALESVMKELWNGKVEIHGESVPPFPQRTVHHLKMIAQEAVTNAIKHANADRIEIRLEGDAETFLMEIRDDGDGFDVPVETSGKAGHFGCIGMRERCAGIGAEISWESESGKGTVVSVSIPL